VKCSFISLVSNVTLTQIGHFVRGWRQAGEEDGESLTVTVEVVFVIATTDDLLILNAKL